MAAAMDRQQQQQQVQHHLRVQLAEVAHCVGQGVAADHLERVRLEGLAKNLILPSRSDLADNSYFQEEPRYIVTAQAVGIGQTPYAFRFNDMVNADQSPWLTMLQTAVFDGDIDGAIEEARETMRGIAADQ